MATHVGEPIRGARAIFLFHFALLSWWIFVQFYYYVVMRFVKADPSFPMGIVSLCLIVTALLVTARFARGLRGTASETAARIAMVLAVIDVIGETLQFAPRLGFPGVIPSDRSGAEFLVRVCWASCEFAMRSAMFVALWRAGPAPDKRLFPLFFALIAANYALAMFAFARAAGPLMEAANAVPFGAFIVKFSMPMSFLWLGIIVYLARRVASEPMPTTSGATVSSA